MNSSHSGRRLRHAVATAVLLAIVAASGASASAADLGVSQETAPARQSDWSVIVSPYLWAASLQGEGALRGIPVNVDVPFSETFKNLDIGLMGVVEVTNGAFGVFVNGEYVDVTSEKTFRPKLPVIGQTEVNVGAGTTTTIVSAGAYYRAFEAPLGGDNAFGGARVLAISPLAGLRWTRLEGNLSVEVPDVASRDVSDSVQWVDPFVGARVDIDLTPRWNLAIEGDVGGFDIGSRISLNGQAYLGYRTQILGHETMWRIGYRALYQDYTKGGFDWDVTQHGPVIGASVRF
ncbi:hypothetical protein [Kaistia nematophila]|uniref:Uncharacterized protein n=1 Tax=Kaistia nematophila TaxID=2994654 RepID=A0A9X3DZF4_9HYPH|nr:hypothetical protein [Kaistia nematophila]MCX5568794.1 hypothetical protein [Kaistia nematophila]